MRNPILKMAVAAVILPFSLGGCATFHAAHQEQQHTEQNIAQYHLPKAPSIVTTVDTPYLMGNVVEVRHSIPSLLKQKMTLVSAKPMNIREIASKITEITGVPVLVENTSNEKKNGQGGTLPPLPSQTGGSIGSTDSGNGYSSSGIPVNWNGSISGFLNMVTAKDGLWWRYRDGAVRIFKTETKTFSIPALAWATQSEGSIIATAGADNSSSGSSGSSGGLSGGLSMSSGSSGSSSQGSSSTGTTDIENTSKINVWSGLQKTAQTVAGDGAEVEADGSTGTVTVTGTPSQINHVREWVSGLSQQLERQVAITVHVYNVTVTNEQNYGLNLSGAFQSLGKQYGVSLQGVAPPSTTSGTTPMSIGANILSSATGALGQFQSSSVAVQALATLGHVSQVFSKSTVSLNGQPAPIQVAQQTGYLAESDTTQTANVGSTSGLIPGTVTTGFTAMFLPRIVGGKILLGMNMTISNLVGIQTISSGGNSIQVPTVDSSTFQQSVKLKPGQTLLLTGYSQAGGSTTHNGVGSPYLPLLGGGADASTNKQMIAIVITARIL